MNDDPDGGDTLTIDIAEPCALWRERLPDARRLCGEAARAALVGAGDMLSFPVAAATWPPGAPRLLGDVVLAFETVAAEATAQGKALAHHLRHLVVHGVLHLLGYDHEAAGEAARMEALEVAVLAGLGVPDPYRVAEASHG
jgi:probable rRNA maturation factor